MNKADRGARTSEGGSETGVLRDENTLKYLCSVSKWDWWQQGMENIQDENYDRFYAFDNEQGNSRSSVPSFLKKAWTGAGYEEWPARQSQAWSQWEQHTPRVSKDNGWHVEHKRIGDWWRWRLSPRWERQTRQEKEDRQHSDKAVHKWLLPHSRHVLKAWEDENLENCFFRGVRRMRFLISYMTEHHTSLKPKLSKNYEDCPCLLNHSFN